MLTDHVKPVGNDIVNLKEYANIQDQSQHCWQVPNEGDEEAMLTVVVFMLQYLLFIFSPLWTLIEISGGQAAVMVNSEDIDNNRN